MAEPYYVEQQLRRINYAPNPSAEFNGGWGSNSGMTPAYWDDTVARSGARSRKQECQSGNYFASMYAIGATDFNGFEIPPSLWGKTVTASVFLMPQPSELATRARLFYSYYIDGVWTTAVRGQYFNDLDNGAWNEIYDTHEVPEDAIRCRIGLEGQMMTGDPPVGFHCWIDDAAYYEGEKDVYFDGSTPEYYGDRNEQHRAYGWTGTPHQSISHEYTGGFWALPHEPDSMYVAPRPPRIPPPKFSDSFNIEVSYGDRWISLTDMINFKVAAGNFGQKSQQRRRIEANSPFYDGTYLIHSTLENITEEMAVMVYGESQNHVTENLLLLEELFSQPEYQVRILFGNHRETWYCTPADWSIDRSHVFMHNTMAIMTLQIPRLPRTTAEVVM